MIDKKVLMQSCKITPRTPDPRDYKLTEYKTLIDEHDKVRETEIMPAHHQGKLGTCYAMAAAKLLTQRMRHNTKDPTWEFSPASAAYNKYLMTGIINGATSRETAQSIYEKGCLLKQFMPYIDDEPYLKGPTSNHLTELSRLHRFNYFYLELEDIPAAINNGYSVWTGIQVFKKYFSQETIKTGIINEPTLTEKHVGGHAILIYDYYKNSQGQIVFKFLNSYGTEWGVCGTGIVTYDYLRKHGFDYMTFDQKKNKALLWLNKIKNKII